MRMNHDTTPTVLLAFLVPDSQAPTAAGGAAAVCELCRLRPGRNSVSPEVQSNLCRRQHVLRVP